MPSDPYAKYLDPPAVAPSSSSDPYAKYLTPPGGGDSAPSAAPNVGYGEALARTFAEGAGGGLADVALGAGGSVSGSSSLPTIASQRARTQAGEDLLPWYVRYPVEGLGVGAGFLSGAGEAGWALRGAEGASDLAKAYGLGAKGAARVGGAVKGAAEAGTYGAVSGAAHSESADPGTVLSNAATGGLTGAALGGTVGGALAKTPIASAPKALSTDETGALLKQANEAMAARPVDSAKVTGTIADIAGDLSPSEMSGMSPGFKAQVNQILKANASGDVSVNDLDSWQRQLQRAATGYGSSPLDSVAASRIGEGLDGLIKDAGAGDLQQTAKEAYARHEDNQAMAGLTLNSAPGWAKSQLAAATAPGSKLRYSDADLQALKNLAKYAKGGSDDAAPGFTKDFTQSLTSNFGQKLGGAALGYVVGGPMGAIAAPVVEAGAGAGYRALYRNPKLQRALDAARASLTTGNAVNPGDYTNMLDRIGNAANIQVPGADRLPLSVGKQLTARDMALKFMQSAGH